MNTYTKEELDTIIAEHGKWLRGEGGKRAHLADANLAGANLADAHLADAYLARANLTGANLADAHLADAYLAGANLTRTHLTRAYLTRAYLAGANLAGANLDNTDLASATLPEGWSYASVSFCGHGECGRRLHALRRGKDAPIEFSCGCFSGGEEKLRKYIEDGDEQYKKSRTLALETIITLINA